MDKEKREQLEAKGWVIITVEELFELTPEELILIDYLETVEDASYRRQRG